MKTRDDVWKWLNKITPKTRKRMKKDPEGYFSFIMHYGEDGSMSIEWQPELIGPDGKRGAFACVG